MRFYSLFPLIVMLLILGCAGGQYKPMDNMVRDKEYDRAIRAYLKILDPHMKDGIRYIYYDPEIITRIGQVYWHMNRHDPAIKILQMVTQKEPDFGMAFFYLGLAYEGQEQYDKAIETYRHYLELPFGDAYRAVLKGRHDWAIRYYSERLIQAAVKNEPFVDEKTLPKTQIAVLNFTHLGQDREWDPLQKGISDMLIQDLSKVEGLQVADRLTILTLEEYLRQTEAEFIENLEDARIAKLLNAGTLIKGSYLVVDDIRITLDANMHIFSQAAQPDLLNYDMNLMRLFMVEKEIVFSILDALGISLDIESRNELLKVPTENLDAFIAYCNALDALDNYNYEKAQRLFRQAVILDNTFKMAEDWIIKPKLWELTHNQNTKRVHYEITQMVQTTSKGRGRIVYQPEPELLSTYYRLQWMGLRQGAMLLPGTDNREGAMEVYEVGVPIIPEMLAEPPAPAKGQ